MNRTAWMIAVGLALGAAGLALGAAGAASAAELDPKVVAFKLPDQIAWVENTRSGNRTAVLQGNPTKPGPYAMLLTWLPGNMSRPHFHPNDRFFIVRVGEVVGRLGTEFRPGGDDADPGRQPRDPLRQGRPFRAGDDPRLGRRSGDVDAVQAGFAELTR